MLPDPQAPWYHGSPLLLTELRAGSTITQDRDLARVFSHKPAVVSQDVAEDGRRTILHTGEQPGYLYRIAEPVGPEDVRPHPRTTMEPGQEWLTNRPLRLELVERTAPRPEERLTETMLAALRSKR
ncbi:MAG: hypothetical protein DIU80_007775 [Chloroflexota bacterium]